MHLISSSYSPHHLRMALTSTPTSEDNRRARYPTLIAPGRRQRAGVRTEFDRMIAVMPRGLGTTQVVGADDPSSSAGCGCCWTGGAAMPMCGKEIETHRLFLEAALEGEGLAPHGAPRASRRAMANGALAVRRRLELRVLQRARTACTELRQRLRLVESGV